MPGVYLRREAHLRGLRNVTEQGLSEAKSDEMMSLAKRTTKRVACYRF